MESGAPRPLNPLARPLATLTPMSDGVSLAAPRTAARLMMWIERGLLLGGVVLFAFLVERLGAADVWANLQLIGWGFVLVFAQEGLAFVFNTIGWSFAFPKPRKCTRFSQLVAARLAGEAINNVTPTATIGGEVVRARMITETCESHVAWASVAVAKLAQTAAQMLFVFTGLVLLVRDVELPAGYRQGLYAGLAAISAGLMLGIALQRRGMFGAAVRLATRLGVRVPQALREHVTRLDAEIARVYAEPKEFAASIGAFFAGWCMGAVEVYIVMYLLGLSPTWGQAVTVEVLSVAIDALFFFVPAKAGVQEGGKALIFQLMGLDPGKGLVLGIVRRLRELSWSLVGLVVLAVHQSRARRKRA
ncbi:MAG: lysylphosphatidylglycerol synthase domain-containing protein [Candidatus Binatia bacterium]